MKIDHIGYLTKDIHKAIKTFSVLGFDVDSEIYVDNIPEEGSQPRNVLLCFLRNENTRIELVSPIDDSSDVYSTISRQGEGPYHICYQVSNMEETLHDLKKEGWIVVKKPAKAIAFNNARVAFMYKRNAGLVEFVESDGTER